MKSRRNLGRVAALFLAAVVITSGTIQLTRACGNMGASNSHHINYQCSYCLCVNGTWMSWYFSWYTNACSGTVYWANVTQDISCGNNWTIVFLPGTATVVTANCNSAPFDGNCDMGACSGTVGPRGPLAEHTLLQSVACPLGDCPG
jgi:hypothetical protein